MPRYRVLPYRQGSKSAKALAYALGGKVLKIEGSTFLPRRGDKIINWGNTGVHPVWRQAVCQDFNLPFLVSQCSNKLTFFQLMQERGVDCLPEFWTRAEDIPDDVYPVVCRTVLARHSGEGIVIAHTREELVPCALYVKYVKKKEEYRVHLGKQEDNNTVVIAIQRKARRDGVENVNWQVRNHRNGFVYVRGDVNPPRPVLDAATRVFKATGLDFGGIDTIWNEREQTAYVLEVNTAVGLEGRTVQDYVNFFNN